jgi:quinoprotein glucose dehydrogenase
MAFRIIWLSIFVFLVSIGPIHAQANSDWNAYLGNKQSNQYSPLTEITPTNAHQLKVAWEYHTGDKKLGQIQTNPLIVDGILYGTSPTMHLFALNAATGQELWKFDPGRSTHKLQGTSTLRGVAFWSNQHSSRILFAAANRLFALDSTTGKPISTFGENGSVDLKNGLGRDTSRLYVVANTPGVVYKDLYILGTRVSEANPAAPGHVRAYNILTGEMKWIFHTIPEPGEFGHDSWPAGAWKTAGGANSWAGMSLDEKRGIVYVPTGSAAYDFYGGDRRGDNLYANTLLALKARTGERVWHYQIVHHDMWDRDIPAPPNLVTIQRKGRKIDAVAQITKSAHVFLFNRKTGEPLFPIEETPVPKSDLIGEYTSPTQPLPTKPEPFSRQLFSEAEITQRTPESHALILDQLKRYRSAGQFVPPSREGTIILPGFDGGGEWGGAAVHPDTGIMYVNASEMPWIITMVDTKPKTTMSKSAQMGRRVYARQCQYCHGVDRKGDSLGEYPALLNIKERLTKTGAEEFIRTGKDMMPSFQHLKPGEMRSVLEFLFTETQADNIQLETRIQTQIVRRPEYGHTGYNRFVDDDGFPAIKPPWGTLNAIDLNKGELLWKVPLGHDESSKYPGVEVTGIENYGGPAITASGLIFIAATKDEKFRVFAQSNGALLWETDLPAGGYATPSVYAVNGKQFVVIACGGGKMGTKSGDSYVAFTL